MAYSTPLTAISNSVFTAAQYNASDRDNMLETFAAKATAAGQIAVSSAVNAIAVRTPTMNTVATGDTFTPTAGVFQDAPTVGPTVTVTTGTKAIVFYSSYLSNGTATGGGYMSYVVSGASTIAATTANALRLMSSAAAELQSCAEFDMPTLTAGSNTFKAQYTTPTTGALSISNRRLLVIPL